MSFQIRVKQYERGTFVMDEDGLFRCTHERAEVDAPCCNGEHCGCGGTYSVYCPDCEPDDVTDADYEGILAAYFEGRSNRW